MENQDLRTRGGESREQFDEAAHVGTFRLALEQAADGVAMIDPAGRFIFMNAQHAKMFGYESDSALIGRPWSVLYPIDEAERLVREVFPLLEAPGNRWRGMAYGVSREGAQVRQEVSLTTLGDGGILCITRDIGARIDADAQRRRLRAELDRAHRLQIVGTHASGIGHDLSNILTAIIGVIDLERHERASHTEETSRLEAVRHWVDRAGDLARRLHRLGTSAASPTPSTELVAAAESATDLLRSGLGINAEISLRTTDELAEVPLDDTTVTQIVVNLLVNARDASPQGARIDAEVATIRNPTAFALPFGELRLQRVPRVAVGELPTGEAVLLRVSDRGAGVPHHVLNRVFEPFFTTKKLGKGSGLGLPVTADAVKGAGGLLEFYSVEGVGTEVRVWLPRIGSERRDSESTGTVLVCTADRKLQDVIGTTVHDAGLQTNVVTDFQNLLGQMLQPGATNALIIDHAAIPEPQQMRLATVRNLIPTLPVLVITHADQPFQPDPGRENAPTGSLMAPFSVPQLTEQLTTLIAGSPAGGGRKGSR